MILRIRPSRVCVRKVRVDSSASGASVVLALLLSTFFVTLGMVSFTMFLWIVGSELGEVAAFPVTQGFLGKRESWLILAIIFWSFAMLIGSFAELLKRHPQEADELPADTLSEFIAATER